MVCGAPNVKADTILSICSGRFDAPGRITNRSSGKSAASESQGMLCSARELELGRDHEGILELHGDVHSRAVIH